MKWRAAMCACMIALFGVGVAVAHDHGSHSKSKKHHHYSQGKHKAKKHHKAKRDHKFREHDREITHAWCHQRRHELPPGLRPIDRLPPQLDARIQVGIVLDVDLRKHVQTLPYDLRHRLPTPPTGVKYVAIGGHVAMIDRAHRLHDLLPRPPLPF